MSMADLVAYKTTKTADCPIFVVYAITPRSSRQKNGDCSALIRRLGLAFAFRMYGDLGSPSASLMSGFRAGLASDAMRLPTARLRALPCRNNAERDRF